jgi:hypothetical protein
METTLQEGFLPFMCYLVGPNNALLTVLMAQVTVDGGAEHSCITLSSATNASLTAVKTCLDKLYVLCGQLSTISTYIYSCVLCSDINDLSISFSFRSLDRFCGDLPTPLKGWAELPLGSIHTAVDLTCGTSLAYVIIEQEPLVNILSSTCTEQLDYGNILIWETNLGTALIGKCSGNSQSCFNNELSHNVLPNADLNATFIKFWNWVRLMHFECEHVIFPDEYYIVEIFLSPSNLMAKWF